MSYLYDGSVIIAEYQSGVLARQYVCGNNQISPDYFYRGGTTFRLIKDRGGSVRLVVDASTGIVHQRLDYDPFGNVILDTNPGFQSLGFAGGVYDGDANLVHFGARDYDPETGRFTSLYPLGFGGGSPNLYRHANADPVNCSDPTGEFLATGDPLIYQVYLLMAEQRMARRAL